jgi:HTH-type transcriptional regulator / antitoxin HigA
VEEMNAEPDRQAVNKRRYAQLLTRALPQVIHTEAENDRCVRALETLHDSGSLTAEKERLAELLTLLIEDFEDRHYQLRAAGPIQAVRELMDANGLKQVDLLDVFGTASVASEVLRGKRNLSKVHVCKLAERFHTSPELFLPVSATHRRRRVRPAPQVA